MIEAIIDRRGYKVTPEQSKKITAAAFFLTAVFISFGGFATFLALWSENK